MRWTRLLVWLVALLALPLPGWAGQRSAQDALEQASALIAAHMAGHGSWGGAVGAHPAAAEELTAGDAVVGWFVSVQPHGFVIVVADDARFPIRCYDDTSLPAQAAEQMHLRAMATGVAPDAKIKQTMTRLLDRPPLAGAAVSAQPEAITPQAMVVLGPLTHSTWHQGLPFNALCPTIGGEFVDAGCLAVAMAQLMYFWQHPARLQRPHEYVWSGTDQSTAEPVPYAWATMQDDYGWFWFGSAAQAEPVARLVHDIGVTLENSYSLAGTGAYMLDAVTALRTAFDYSEKVELVLRGSMTADQLMSQTILPEIAAGAPCLMSISTGPFEGGHAVVVDGYENLSGQQYIHLNFGWGNVVGTNTWYHPDEVVLGDEYDFSYTPDQSVIRSIRPMDHVRTGLELRELASGALATTTTAFAAAPVDSQHLVIVYDALSGSFTHHWNQMLLDPASGAVSNVTDLGFETSGSIPQVLGWRDGRYVLVYQDLSGVRYQVRTAQGARVPLSTDTVGLSSLTEWSAAIVGDDLLIASMRLDQDFRYGPCLWVHSLDVNMAHGDDILGGVFLTAPVAVAAGPLASGQLVVAYQVDDTMRGYLFSEKGDPMGPFLLSAIATSQCSRLECTAVGGGFVLSWLDQWTFHGLAQAFALPTMAQTASRVLEASDDLPVGAAAALPSGTWAAAYLAPEGCAIQLYDQDLSRVAQPAWFPLPAATIDGAVTLDALGANKLVAVWLDDTGFGQPSHLAYGLVQAPGVTLPWLVPLMD